MKKPWRRNEFNLRIKTRKRYFFGKWSIEKIREKVRRELMGFRLDWFRFQAYTSQGSTASFTSGPSQINSLDGH